MTPQAKDLHGFFIPFASKSLVVSHQNPYQAPKTLSSQSGVENLFRQRSPMTWWIVIPVGLLVPGLMYFLFQRDAIGLIVFLLLLFGIPLAFAFFGPFWDIVLFDDSRLNGLGLYPFLAACLLIPVASLILAISANRRATQTG